MKRDLPFSPPGSPVRKGSLLSISHSRKNSKFGGRRESAFNSLLELPLNDMNTAGDFNIG